MATKLDVYKTAALHLGKATINSLTDDIPARYTFDIAWQGVVEEALNEGDWNFSKKTVELLADPLALSHLGWNYAFVYPADYIRTVYVGTTANSDGATNGYEDISGALYSNNDKLYLHYISSDAASDVESWPTMFWRYVALKLAFETCDRLTEGTSKTEQLFQRCKKALRQAKNIDARNNPVQEIPAGSWLRARRGGSYLGKGNYIGVVGGSIQLEEGDV